MPIGSLVQNDDWSFKITVNDSSGNGQDITGGTVWLTFKQDPKTQDDAAADFQTTNVNIQPGDEPGDDPTNGIVYLRVASDTSGLGSTDMAVGSYQFDVQYKDPVGVVATLELGSVSVVQEVTRDV